jgi:hypothetical protein
MAIDRTVFNASVDDSGAGTDGTIEDKAWFTAAILNPIDAALAASGVTQGTWTPSLTANGGASGQVYGSQQGHYIKIGPLVFLTYYVALSTKGTLSGNVAIAGFPFTPSSTGAAPGLNALTWINLVTTWVNVVALPAAGNPWAWLTGATTASTTNNTALTGPDIGNSTAFLGAMLYRT